MVRGLLILLFSVLILPQTIFAIAVMEIRIVARKSKSNFKKKNSTLGSIKPVSKERFFPLFELMMKELETEQTKNEQRSIEQ